jgi:hypothetical protein
MQWQKLEPAKTLVVFACGNCGAAAFWTGDDSDVADSVPFCADCEQPMTFSHVCVATQTVETKGARP